MQAWIGQEERESREAQERGELPPLMKKITGKGAKAQAKAIIDEYCQREWGKSLGRQQKPGVKAHKQWYKAEKQLHLTKRKVKEVIGTEIDETAW